MKVSLLLASLASATMAYGTNNATSVSSQPFMLTFFSSSPQKSKCDAQVNRLQDSIFDSYLKELMEYSKVPEDDAKGLVASSFQVTENRLLMGQDDGAENGLVVSTENDDRKLQYCTRYICTQAYIVIKAEGCLKYCGYRRTEEAEPAGADENNQVATTDNKDNRELQYCTRYICTQAYIVIKAEGCLKYCGYRRTQEAEPAGADENNQVATTDNKDNRELQYCTRYICTQAYIVIKAEGCLKYCGYRRTEEAEPAGADENSQVATTENKDRELQYCTRYICTQAYIVIKAEGCLKYCGYRRTEEAEPTGADENNQVATTDNNDRELQYCTRYICTQAYIVIKAEGCLKYCGYRRTEEAEPAGADKNNQVAITENANRELQYCTRYICTQAYIVIKAEGCLKYCGYRRTEEAEPAGADESNQVATTDNEDNRELQYCTRYICTQAYIVIKAEGCLKYCGYRRTEEAVPVDQNNQVAATDNNDRELQYCTRYICTQAYIVIKAEGCLKYCGYRRTMEEEGEPTQIIKKGSNLRRRQLDGTDNDTERALSTKLIASAGNSTKIIVSAPGHQLAEMFYKNIDKMIDESDVCNPILKAMSFEVMMVNLHN